VSVSQAREREKALLILKEIFVLKSLDKCRKRENNHGRRKPFSQDKGNEKRFFFYRKPRHFASACLQK
jgi:hypothetical protein